MTVASPSTNEPAPADENYDAWIAQETHRTERLMRLLTEWWWDHGYRLQAHGVEHVPREGAFLLVPNHSSYADPFLQVRPLQRRLRFMAKSSMFRHPVVRHVMQTGGAFPVRRGAGDAFAMELARRLLHDGQPVVMYPEGTRFRDSLELGPARRGAARLALDAGVPVVPAATWGVKRRGLYGRYWWRRPMATTVYGAPMDFTHLSPTPEHVNLVRDEVWRRVQELYEEARALATGR